MENQPSTDLATTSDFANLLPSPLKQAYLSLPPELHLLTEAELKKVCYPKAKDATSGRWRETTFTLDDKLRHSLWLEFELSISQNREMSTANVCNRIVTEQHLGIILKNPMRAAWITYPPGNYTVDVETLLSRTTQRLFEMVEVPFVTKLCRCHYICRCKPKGIKRGEWDELAMCACKQQNGCLCPERVDTKAMELILKMRDSLELRAKGSIPQIINQKTLSVQFHGKAQDQAHRLPESMEQIKNELEELRAKRQALMPAEEIERKPE